MSAPGKNFAKDPWSTCGCCRFWIGQDNEISGTCHRSSPNIITNTPQPWAVWPITAHDDVCGEFAVEVDE